jgi:zinc transport system substrate-binding protein
MRELTVIAGFFCILSSVALADELKVVATIKPIHSLVAQVMGETGNPELLVSGSQSPHTFVMKPSDMRKLSAATVVFRVGTTVEPFTIKVAQTLPKSVTLVTLQDAPGVKTLKQRAGGPFEAHDHHDGHGHGGDHDDDDDAPGAIDGHIWLDPDNAKAMIDAIAVTLTRAGPGQAATYAANAERAKARIDTLAADLSRELADIAGRPYVVFHDAYQYFEARFGLNVVGSITVNPDIPPSGKRLAELRGKIKRLGARCVFGEPYFEGKVIGTVIEGSGAQTGTLDPEGAALAAGPDLYDTLMRTLARNLKGCLERGK